MVLRIAAAAGQPVHEPRAAITLVLWSASWTLAPFWLAVLSAVLSVFDTPAASVLAARDRSSQKHPPAARDRSYDKARFSTSLDHDGPTQQQTTGKKGPAGIKLMSSAHCVFSEAI
jgi:hypothetical protein